MVGLFPLQRVRGTYGTTLRLFDHDYSFLKTPLLRRGHAVEAWHCFLDWGEKDSQADLIELPGIRAEGPPAQSLVAALHERRMLSLVTDWHARALLSRAASADAYIEETLTAKNRHEVQRQQRRLSELGSVECRLFNERCDADEWREDFLQLEAHGWKGAANTAFAKSSEGRQFFTEAFRRGAQAGRLQLLGLWLNDRPIALKLNLLSPPGAFAFKIAYDEEFSKYSPGVQLELQNIHCLHACLGIQWMDSCAAPDHPMINRLWRERTIIQDILISTGTVRGHLALGLRPLARAARRLFRRHSVTKPLD
jgi:CelD/BcsL family acetyltransferase involved in cellulose biosynthesis